MTTLSNSRRCLFGGTILAAGIAAQPAQAQTFDLVYSVAGTFCTFGAGTSYFNGAGPFSISSADVYGNYASAWGQPESMGTDAFSPAPAYGYASAAFYFYVTSDGTATASWDFTGDQTYAFGYAIITDLTNGTTLFSKDWNDAPGSESIPLSAGIYYQWRSRSFASYGAGASHAILTIPAPGSAAILAVAGLLATRRRRE